MKRMSRLVVMTLMLLVGLTVLNVFPQTIGQADQAWLRVQSDDGEFSVEVPATYKYFFSKPGFTVSKVGKSDKFEVSSMRMLTSLVDGTLIGFECYEAGKQSLDALYDDETYKRTDMIKSEIKGPGYTIKQLVLKVKNSYAIRQYFLSKNNIYILTAASRSGETATMRRFLDSLQFAPDGGQKTLINAKPLSGLPVTDVALDYDLNATYPEPKTATKEPVKFSGDESLILISKPRPAYTVAARQSGVKGLAAVRTTFEADGRVSKLVVIRQLSDGLLRQVVFAAIRIRFLPPVKNNKPDTVTRVIEYYFDIY